VVCGSVGTWIHRLVQAVVVVVCAPIGVVVVVVGSVGAAASASTISVSQQSVELIERRSYNSLSGEGVLFYLEVARV
jgi:hypothetical protein